MREITKTLLTIALILTVSTVAIADIIEHPLPYEDLEINAWGGTSMDGYYTDYAWRYDGRDNTLHGTIDQTTLTPGDAWIKVGFGSLDAAGCIAFFADTDGQRKAYLEYADGSVNSNIIILAPFGQWDFELTVHENGTCSAWVSDFMTGQQSLMDNGLDTIDLTTSEDSIFAIGSIDDDKAIAQCQVDIHVPEPMTLSILTIGAIAILRRKK